MAIRKGDWKLVKTTEGPLKEANPYTFNDLSSAELYNLAEDIGETKDLAAASLNSVSILWRFDSSNGFVGIARDCHF
jgi:hypothetical protein